MPLNIVWRNFYTDSIIVILYNFIFSGSKICLDILIVILCFVIFDVFIKWKSNPKISTRQAQVVFSVSTPGWLEQIYPLHNLYQPCISPWALPKENILSNKSASIHGQYIPQISFSASDFSQITAFKSFLHQNSHMVTVKLFSLKCLASYKNVLVLQDDSCRGWENIKSEYVLFVITYYLNYDKVKLQFCYSPTFINLFWGKLSLLLHASCFC